MMLLGPTKPKLASTTGTKSRSLRRCWCCTDDVILPKYRRDSRRHTRLRLLSGLLDVPKKPSSRQRRRNFLNSHERLLVQRTWIKLSTEVCVLGMDSMMTLWDLCPEVPKVFQLPPQLSKDLQRDARFHQHACWLIQVVSATVENLDSLGSQLADTFKDIGLKHAAVPLFPEKTFSALPHVWSSVWDTHLTGRYNEQTEEAWVKVFQYITDFLIEGFHRCKTTQLPDTPTPDLATMNSITSASTALLPTLDRHLCLTDLPAEQPSSAEPAGTEEEAAPQEDAAAENPPDTVSQDEKRSSCPSFLRHRRSTRTWSKRPSGAEDEKKLGWKPFWKTHRVGIIPDSPSAGKQSSCDDS